MSAEHPNIPLKAMERADAQHLSKSKIYQNLKNRLQNLCEGALLWAAVLRVWKANP